MKQPEGKITNNRLNGKKFLGGCIGEECFMIKERLPSKAFQIVYAECFHHGKFRREKHENAAEI